VGLARAWVYGSIRRLALFEQILALTTKETLASSLDLGSASE
jgi:hypothetical protein